MRVLHLCPLWYPIAPDAPGGIETLLARLLTHLEQLGCQNTVLATGDSVTDGELVPVLESGLAGRMRVGTAFEYVHYEQHQFALALERASEFDLIHSHVGPTAYFLSSVVGLAPVLHTQHTPVFADLQWFVSRHSAMWFSTVSEFQARKLVAACATRCQAIHNGIEVADFRFSDSPGDGLLFIGRMEHAKGPDIAVRVARALDRPLTLAGPIVDGRYFDETIRPFLDDRIRYVGVVDHEQKVDLFGRAACAVLPFQGEESFGLVAVEAMACGTPVVALANGALPEIVEPGLTGYITQDVAEISGLTLQALVLDRAAIRSRVGTRFDIAVAAEQYRKLYAQIVATAHQNPGRTVRYGA